MVSAAVAIARWDAGAAAGVNRARAVADAAGVERAYARINVVARTVAVRVCSTITAAHPEGVELVSVAVAVASRDTATAAGVNRARTVAYATGVERAYARIDIVAGAVAVRVRSAITAAHPEGVELVSVAVAVAGRDLRAAAGVDRARAVAHAAGIERADARVDVVAGAIAVRVCCAIATARPESVNKLARTIVIV